MAYNLTLTNGTTLTAVGDTTVDTVTTSLSLVGKNYAGGYGLFLNQNFVKLMEHFSNSTAPVNPLKGQLWWDTTNKHLSVYTGNEWKVISSSQTGISAPPNPVTGDFWWNTSISQLSVYSGTGWVTVGPYSSPGAALTAILANSASDGSTTHYVGNIVVNNKLSAIFSSDATSYTPSPSISGLPSIVPGLNLIAGLNVGGNATVSGNTILANLSAGSTTITSNLMAGNLTTTGSLNAGPTSITGNLAAGNLSVTSTISAGSLKVSGNILVLGNITLPNNSTTFSSITGNVSPSANLTYNLGSSTSWWNNIYGTAIHAQYADLAERFEADAVYAPGTVVEIGGPAEITEVEHDLSEDVFGVISTNAAYLMNSGAGSNTTHPPVAVQGRVPVRVTGVVHKGDRLVSAGNGVARAGKRSEITTWNVIGRALEDKTTPGLGVVEAVVKLNS